MQLCAEGGAVVTTGGGGVWAGDTVTPGGFPAVHPLTIIKPTRTSRRMNNKPEVFRAMVPDITGDVIIIWEKLRFWRTGHEPVRSHSTHENRTIYNAPPPQGLSEAWRAWSFSHRSTWGVLFWGGGIHRT